MTERELALFGAIAEMSQQLTRLYEDHYSLIDERLLEQSHMLDALIVEWYRAHGDS